MSDHVVEGSLIILRNSEVTNSYQINKNQATR